MNYTNMNTDNKVPESEKNKNIDLEPPPGYSAQNPDFKITLEGLVNGLTIIGECR